MEEKEFDYINVIPLVDVMLVLLTIVLMTSTFIASGAIPVDLPKASKQEETLKTLTIVINETGSIYFNDRPASLQGLEALLRSLNRNTPILVRADRDLRLQLFVDLLDLVKNLGFRKVSLQTETKK